jgi:hypothetical protein
LSNDGSLVLGAPYQEAVYRGNVFFAANQAAVTFSVGLTTTTAIGLIIANPPGSGKLVIPLQVEFANTGVIVGTAALVVRGYSSTAVAHTTALTPLNARLGGSAPVATADQGAGLTTAPVVWKALYSVLTTNTAALSSAALYDLGGSLIVPQGCAYGVLASAAITGFCSTTWMEIDA